jgi:hypothetical protein
MCVAVSIKTFFWFLFFVAYFGFRQKQPKKLESQKQTESREEIFCTS